MQPLFCHRAPAILSIAHVMSCPACRTTHVKVRCCWGLGGNVINSTWMKLAQVGRRCSWDSKEMCKWSWFSKSVYSHPLASGYLADLTHERIICKPQKGPLWNVRYIIKTYIYIITYIYLFNLTDLYYSILLVWVGLGGNTHTGSKRVPRWLSFLQAMSTRHTCPKRMVRGPALVPPTRNTIYIYILCIHIANISRLHFCQSTVYQVKWPVCVSLKMMQPGRLLWCIINQKYILAYFT